MAERIKYHCSTCRFFKVNNLTSFWNTLTMAQRNELRYYGWDQDTFDKVMRIRDTGYRKIPYPQYIQQKGNSNG